MADERGKKGAASSKGAGASAGPSAEVSADETVRDAEHRMQRAIESLQEDFHTVRTGRASSQMLDRITVDYYGAPTPITQVANISVPEPRQITITPWEKNMFGPIEKAIQKSDLGVMPTNDGKQIRLNFPMLTEQRRKEMVKVVQKRAEEGRVAVRNCRRDAQDRLKRAERDKSVSEDESKRLQERLQKLTDRFVGEVDRVTANKEKEVLEV